MAVSPTVRSLTKLKMLVDNTANPAISDSELYVILSDYALADSNDTVPDGEWELFDYNGAAAEAWRIKASRAAGYISTSADGQQMSFNQIREACQTQYQYYTTLRNTTNITVTGST